MDQVNLTEDLFKSLFKEYCLQLRAYSQSRFQIDSEVSKDVVNTAFVRLWEKRNELKSLDSLKSYLFRSVTTISLDLIKRQQVESKYKRFVIAQPPLISSQDSFSRQAEVEKQLHQAIDELPNRMRKIFILNKLEGRKYADVASQLNISIKTVEVQIRRAVAKLQSKLSQYRYVFFPAFAFIQNFIFSK